MTRPRSILTALAIAGVSALATGCAGATPPPGWQQGGAAIYPVRATWTHRFHTIELYPDGRVIINGRDTFAIDRAGRVMDPESNPVALLRPDGRLVGAGNEDWGAVGPTAAALPGAKSASIAIAPGGQVIRYGDDGDQRMLGSWAGCDVYAVTLQACMLVTYLVATHYQPSRPFNRYPTTPYSTPYGSPYGSPYMGPGVGFGLGIP